MGAIINLNLILRLVIWFLLTADFSWANIVIGVAIAWFLPGRKQQVASNLKDWLQLLWNILYAIPQAYLEAVQIMIQPHNKSDIVRQPIKRKRSPGLIFLDIFLITFTPKTIVMRYDEHGWYEIHRIKKKH